MTTLQSLINRVEGDSPQVFVTTYGLYNEGRQFANEFTGFWISCEDFNNNRELVVENFEEQGDEDPELMFTDCDNLPSDLYCESGMDFDLIQEWTELDGTQQKMVDGYCTHVNSDVKEAIAKLEDMYLFQGDYGDYAREDVENCGVEIPAKIQNYINYDQMGEDLADNSGGVYKLSNNELLIVNE